MLAGSAWFWGARFGAGALLSLGSGPGPAHAFAWLGVGGAAWALAPLAGAGSWMRVAGAALLIGLPEAIVAVSGRLTSAGVLGLRVQLPAVVLDGVWRMLLVSVPLAILALVVHAVPRALTSARPRSPT
jgi:hypothetical protein